MSFENISVSHIENYGRNVQMMAQQMGSKLRDKVLIENPTGERHYFELYNTNASMNEVTTRHADVNITDTQFERRAVDLVDYDDAKLIGTFDQIKMLIDPMSSVVQAQAAQMGRQIDDIIIGALHGNMLTGKSGGTSVAPTNTIAVDSWDYGTGSGNSNLTISKLIEASATLDDNDVPMEDRFVVIDPINHAKLLATAEATSSDFVTARSLETGEVTGLVGFEIIKSTRLPVDGSGYRRCFAWHKTGMGLAIGKDVTSKITERNDKSGYPYQAYICLSMAATALENSKRIEIKCLAS